MKSQIKKNGICNWVCVDYVGNETWIYKTDCSKKLELSRKSKIYYVIKNTGEKNICPICKRTAVCE